MWRCSDELKQRAVLLEAHAKKEAKHYVGKVSDPYISLSFVVIVVYSVSRWELAFDKV